MDGKSRIRPVVHALESPPPSSCAAAAARRLIAMLGGAAGDARYTLRVLRREPHGSLVAAGTIALAIAVTTVLFSIVYGVLLRPLPWPDADRIVRVEETRGGRRGRLPWTITNATYHSWRESPATVEAVGGWSLTQAAATLTGAGEPERLSVASVTPDLLAVIQARPHVGRLLTSEEGAAHDDVLISFGLWQERFGGRDDVLGRSVRLDGRVHTIVGVMPRDFAFPDTRVRAWTAMRVMPVVWDDGTRRVMLFGALARLRPGATPEQASAEATARARAAPDIANAGLALFGAYGPIQVTAVAATEAVVGGVRPALMILFCGVGLLFLTATASIATVQLARAAARMREMAVRAAIGAAGSQLARQWLVEAGLVALCGGVAGVLLAFGVHATLPALLPPDFPRRDDIVLDQRVLLFAALLTVAAAAGSGIAPARWLRRADLAASLAGDGSGRTNRGRQPSAHRLRLALSTAQVAIACVLLVGGGLLARSFTALTRADRGYDPANVLTAQVPFPADYPVERRVERLERLQERLRTIPGVTDVGFGNGLPLVSLGGAFGRTIPSPLDPGTTIDLETLYQPVSPGYFEALGLRMVAGRPLVASDEAGSVPVLVVNRAFAARYLAERPLGLLLRLNLFAHQYWQVVGMVDDVRQNDPGEPPQPQFFVSYKQAGSAVSRDPVLVARTVSEPASYVRAVRAALRDTDASLALESIMTMEERVSVSLARPRTYAALLGAFGVFALAVAAAGLFGLLSYMTSQRRHEFGVRSALGARPLDLAALVFRQAAVVAGAGVCGGLGVAYLLASSLSRVLYGVSARDPLTFAVVPVVFAAVAAAACAVPARRAAQVDPVVSLKG